MSVQSSKSSLLNSKMENLLVHQRKATKKSKTKTKPIKVVYISNPMKVKTCASKFRALVQELTGQDAPLPDPTKFKTTHTGDDHVTSAANNQTALLDAANTTSTVIDDDDHHALEEVPMVDPSPSRHHQPQNCDFSFEPFDDDHGMLENFSGIFASTLFCESSQFDGLRSLDAM
ncbi:hypothetical protein ACOSQ2_026825 [Xanthoceras sorbifolium]